MFCYFLILAGRYKGWPDTGFLLELYLYIRGNNKISASESMSGSKFLRPVIV